MYPSSGSLIELLSYVLYGIGGFLSWITKGFWTNLKEEVFSNKYEKRNTFDLAKLLPFLSRGTHGTESAIIFDTGSNRHEQHQLLWYVAANIFAG